MVEHSKGFRTGRITKFVQRGRLSGGEGADYPFVGFQMNSEIPIGFGETSVEDTNVLLVGDACVRWWDEMLPHPNVGDTVQISYATFYVKNGVGCMRVLDPSQVTVIPVQTAKAAPGMDTYSTINAADFFRAHCNGENVTINQNI